MSIQPKEELPKHQTGPQRSGLSWAAPALCVVKSVDTPRITGHDRDLGSWDLGPPSFWGPQDTHVQSVPSNARGPDTWASSLGFLSLSRDAPCPQSGPSGGPPGALTALRSSF